MKTNKIPAKASYNLDVDVYSARPLEREYESSFQLGNFIFDINKKNQVVGLEILNASKVFNVPKSVLAQKPEKLLIEVGVSDDRVLVSIVFTVERRNAHRTSSVSVEKVKPDFLAPSHMNLAVA